MKFLIIFIYLITTSVSYSIETPDIKNIVINKDPKKYENITFKDINNKNINLKAYKNKLIILNFWATWCAPCLEEMPSLDLLQVKKKLDNLIIFPINVGQDNTNKSKKFFEDLGVRNLKPYFDSPITLAKIFKLRGIPTSILFNKKGEEFARIIGSINFQDKKFIEWLSEYN